MTGPARDPVRDDDRDRRDPPGVDRPVAEQRDRLVGAERVLAILKELALHPAGASLDDLTRAIGSPKPTVHRALGALRRAGFADQDEQGRYRLGDEYLRLAYAHHEARPDHVRVRPVLAELAERFGETAHYSVLDGREVIYRAKVDPPSGAVRLTSTVGGRNPAHSTAVGKALLAARLLTRDQVAAWAGGDALERRTEWTHTTVDELNAELELTRARGYAVDAEENEVGVNCVALPVCLNAPGVVTGAISVSALTYRMPLAELAARVDEIRTVIGPLGVGG